MKQFAQGSKVASDRVEMAWEIKSIDFGCLLQPV